MNVVKALPRIIVGGLLAILLDPAALQASEGMTPGQWDFTMTTKGESHSLKTCITPELAATANGDSASGWAAAEKAGGKSCSISEFKVDGNTVSYSMKCGDTTILTTATYHGDWYEGVLKTKTASGETTTEVKARRLGACPK